MAIEVPKSNTKKELFDEKYKNLVWKMRIAKIDTAALDELIILVREIQIERMINSLTELKPSA